MESKPLGGDPTAPAPPAFPRELVRLSKLVDDAAKTHARFDVTRNRTRAAVLMSADDFDSLMETLG